MGALTQDQTFRHCENLSRTDVPIQDSHVPLRDPHPVAGAWHKDLSLPILHRLLLELEGSKAINKP